MVQRDKIQTQPLAEGLLVKVVGDVDVVAAPVLRNELMAELKQKPALLVVDLSDVSFMDSSGVATLVETLRVQNKQGGKLVLCQMQPRVQGIFEISRLDALFTITADVEAAQQA